LINDFRLNVRVLRAIDKLIARRGALLKSKIKNRKSKMSVGRYPAAYNI